MSQGTLELVAIELGKALQPLKDLLTADQVNDLFAELGLEFSGALSSQTAFISSLGSAASAAETLPASITQLVTAIQGDDVGGILSAVEKIVETVKTLLTAFDAIANQLQTVAAGLPGMNAGDVTAFAGQLAERLAEYTVVTYLEGFHPILLRLLALLGIVELIYNPGVDGDPSKPSYTQRRLRLDHVSQLIGNPDSYLQSVYGWGTNTFDGKLLLERIHDLLSCLSIPATYTPASTPPTLQLLLLEIKPRTDIAPPGMGAVLTLDIPENLAFSVPIIDGRWALEMLIGGEIAASAGILIQPPANVSVIPPSGTVQGDVAIGIARAPMPPDSSFVILGGEGSTLSASRVSLHLITSLTWNSGTGAQGSFGFDGKIAGGKLHISADGADGFLATLLAGVSLDANFDVGFGWTTGKGFYFSGSTALQIQLPAHISLGPIDLSAITLSVGIQGSSFPIGLATDISADLGPLRASVQQIGVSVNLSFPSNGRGNLGPLQAGFAFQPPRGAGLAINAGVVSGGGFLTFDPDQGQYAGVAQLSIADVVTVNAIGLITTKMPDGSSGFSLLLILTTDFPPIQLGFGFTLNGVGGLLGLNRSAQLDTLRDGVRTGTVDDIMFPTDIIANAPRIISDLKAAFPPQENVFLVGPMAKFGWGDPSLVTLSIGIIVEIPPGNIAILGVLKVALPTEDEALILIQVAFIGILDFDEQLLSFDASLYDSHIIFMTMQGDMAVRLKWGDNAAFILSVGGFHPAFHPPDGLHLPASMQRLSITILDYDWAKIKVDCYFAVTSNTVQFGAHLYLFFGVDSANITGQLGLDVLFQFSPFMFIAQISGSLSISVAGMDLMSIGLNFQLSGPSPWEAKGTGSLSILFFSIDVSFDVTWGEAKNTTLPPIDVMPIFLGEIDKQSNWKALPPPSTNLLVTLRSVDPALLVLHPFGSLTLSQRALPLNLKLDKVGNQQPDDVNRVDITQVASAGTNLPLSDEPEQFAMAQFQNMSDSDKLSRASYQDLKGGVIIGNSDSMLSSKMTRRTISYDITIIDKEPQQPLPKGRHYGAISGLFHPFLSGSAAARSPLSYQRKTQLRPFSDTISVSQEGYAVSNTTDNSPVGAAATFSSEAMARDYMKSQVASGVASPDAVHVLPNSEVNAP